MPKYPNFARLLTAHLKAVDITPYRIGEETPIKAPNLHKVLKGEREPTEELIKQLAGYKDLGLTISQLRAWKATDDYPEFSSQIQEISRYLDEPNLVDVDKNVSLNDALQAGQRPLMGNIACGNLTLIENPQYEEFLPVIQNMTGDEWFWLRVDGDSMEPILQDGLFILVRPATEFVNGELFIVETTDYEATCKFVEQDEDGWLLTPANPKHEPKRISMDSVNRLFVIEGEYRPRKYRKSR